MEKANFFNTQNVYAEDLNNINTTVSNQLVARTQGVLGVSGGYTGHTYTTTYGGILGDPTDTSNGNFLCSRTGGSDFIIYSGKAITSDGEFVSLDTTPNYITVDKTALTPNSQYWTDSGVASQTGFIAIRYRDILATPVTDDYGTTQYKQYNPGYVIGVITDTERQSSTLKWIVLYSFVFGDNSELGASITDQRCYARIITTADAVKLDPGKTPPSLAHTTLSDHVYATGSATPTNINPHGISIDDLGGLTPTKFAKYSFENGIVLPDWTVTSTTSMATSVAQAGTDVLITVNALSSGSVAICGSTLVETGAAISQYISITKWANALSVSGDPDIKQMPSDNLPVGAYFITVVPVNPPTDITLQVVLLAANSIMNNYLTYKQGQNYLNLGYTIVSYATGWSATPVVDYRQYHVNSPLRIRADFSEGATTPTATLSKLATLYDNLARIRYQLNIALGASDWKQNYSSLAQTTTQSFTIGAYTGLGDEPAAYRLLSPDEVSTHYTQIRIGDSDFGTNNTDLHIVDQDLVYKSLYLYKLGVWNSSSNLMRELSYNDVNLLQTKLIAGPTVNADAYHTHTINNSVFTTGSTAQNFLPLSVDINTGSPFYYSSVTASIYTNTTNKATLFNLETWNYKVYVNRRDVDLSPGDILVNAQAKLILAPIAATSLSPSLISYAGAFLTTDDSLDNGEGFGLLSFTQYNIGEDYLQASGSMSAHFYMINTARLTNDTFGICQSYLNNEFNLPRQITVPANYQVLAHVEFACQCLTTNYITQFVTESSKYFIFD